MKEKIFKARGSHQECGEQVGEHFKIAIQKAVAETTNYCALGMNWEMTLAMANKYWEKTLVAYPQMAEEIVGVAIGAGVDRLILFSYMIEELWAGPVQEAKACSDIVVTAPLTDGRIIVGHNNDVSAEMGTLMFPVEWNFDDGTNIFIVGPLGFYVSVGVNSHGLALTGNEVTQNDIRMGVPRSIIARAILTANNIDEAIKIATDTRRASSYNNIVSTKDRVIDIEGSASAYELLEPNNGVLVHTNHYVCPTMLKFEGKPNYTSSIDRLKQGQEMVTVMRDGKISERDVEIMLADHCGMDGNDNTVCRHGEKSETTFGITIDFGDGIVRLAMGNPCKNNFEVCWKIPAGY